MEKATRQFSKDHNKRLISKLLYQQRLSTRAEIARATHLTRTTVSKIVAELIQEGLVSESGRGASEGGKPPVVLKFQDESSYLIGVDLANSSFRGAITDLRGRLLHLEQLPVEGRSGAEALEQTYALIDRLMATVNRPLVGIGVGAPGLMDMQAGVIRQAVNLGWNDLPLRDLLYRRYNVPVHIANDSHVAALGEYIFGGGLDSPNLIVVKAGRGISCGIVLNGQLYHGEGSGTGEIGHVVVIENGEACPCGNHGCLETVASTRAMLHEARIQAARSQNSPLSQYAHHPDELNTEALLELFHQGDAQVLEIVRQAGNFLGIAIANIVGLLGIRQIRVGGSLARFGEFYLGAVTETMQRHAHPLMSSETEVTLCRLGQELVIKGAAALLLANELDLGQAT